MAGLVDRKTEQCLNDASPDSWEDVVDKNSIQIGIIGMGDMGRLYAHKFSEAGFAKYVEPNVTPHLADQ